jgi:very-short-patch-repair endonuclease
MARTPRRIDQFSITAQAVGCERPVQEYRFHPERKWRFDYAWVEAKVAVEVEGGAYTGGRHTRGRGFINDMEKYNAAAAAGWCVLRFTPSQLHEASTYDMIVDAIRFRQRNRAYGSADSSLSAGMNGDANV